MNKVVILTDSTSYLPQEQLAKYNISTIPLEVIWGDETFLDGVTIQPEAFYRRLKTAKSMPSTSQPAVGAMKEIFSRLLEQDVSILGIFILFLFFSVSPVPISPVPVSPIPIFNVIAPFFFKYSC